MAIAQETITVDVREVTPDEVEHLREKGWVKLPGLIGEEAARDLLERAKALVGENADGTWAPERGFNRNHRSFRKYYSCDEDDPRFRALRTNRQIGRNAALLFGRDMAIRSVSPLLAMKMPHALSGTIEATTDFHQDTPNVPARSHSLNAWLALDEATPEMGTMRFYEGSHKLGLLAPPVLDWPQVDELPLSPPLHYRPGDATVHHGLTVHGAPENNSDRVRWSWILSCFPAHAPYLDTSLYDPNTHVFNCADRDLHREIGLVSGKPLSHPSFFPIAYDPAVDA